jgi:hypothetical protein
MMREFPSLLIDDHDVERKNFKSSVGTLLRQKYTALGQVDDVSGDVIDDTVYELIFGFYLVAFLDLKFGSDVDLGKEYAELLMQHQPLCERILRSHVFGSPDCPADSEKLKEFFGPFSTIFNSYMPKGNAENLKNIVRDRSKVFGLSQESCDFPVVNIEWGDFDTRLSEWAEKIVAKIKQPSVTGQRLSSKFKVDDHGKAIQILTQSLKFECDYLVSRVCGQGLHGNRACPVDRISLTLLDEGKSSSLVLMGQPTIKGLDSGVWLVFKIDVIERIKTELSGFDNYIKFRVARGRRVEVLGHAVGNRLGTICYTFVGANPKRPITLKTFLHQVISSDGGDGFSKVGQYIENLFSKPDLHEVRDQGDALNECVREFSRKRLGGNDKKFDLDEIWIEISKDIGELFKNSGISRRMPKPNAVLTATLMGTPQPKCWSHGDLHLSNVVLGEGDDLILIDFRDTGPAPQVWDFMTLATSIRLEASCSLDVQYDDSTLKSFLKDEEDFLKVILDPNREPISIAKAKNPDWRSLLISIIQWMKKTFSDHELVDLRREFLACSFVWCCYIFIKIKSEIESPKIDEKQALLLKKKQLSLAFYLYFLSRFMIKENR